MDILQIGAQLLNDRLGLNLDVNTVKSALGGLLGGNGEQIDIAGLVTKFTQQGGLQSAVSSWLGDGGNDGLDISKIMSMFGGSELDAFSSKLGVSQTDAADGLSDVIPQMIDKASGGGSLLDSFGGVGGLLGEAKKLF